MAEFLRRYAPRFAVHARQPSAQSWHPIFFMLVAAASMTLMLNGPFYEALQTHIPHQWGLQFTLVLLVFMLNLMLLLMMAHGRFLKPVVLLLFFVGSISLYFNQAFGTLIDKDMLQNAIETDPAEALSLLSSGLFFHVMQWMLFPWLLVSIVPVQRISAKTYGQQILLAFALWVLTLTAIGTSQYADLASFFRNFRAVKHLALPASPIFAGISLASKTIKSQVPQQFHVLASDATRQASVGRPKLLVLVIGETARADHFQLNGYARNTTPLLSQLPLISFSSVSSCGTATAHSIPCMFSAMTREDYNETTAKTSSNVIDILNATGVNTLWLDNNSGCKGVCDRVHSEFLFQKPDPRCHQGQCLDDVLLDGLVQALRVNTASDRIIVLHQLGSHGPEYFKRSADKDKVFMPECRNNQLQLCTPTEITNAYDNSIVATDRLLANVIMSLQQQAHYNAAMLYISDHGESLGENGVYLHGLPYFMAPQAQTHVPLIWWMSPEYSKVSHIKADCLAQNRDKPMSHDHLFHSLLAAFSVKTSLYQASLDMFSDCTTQAMVE